MQSPSSGSGVPPPAIPNVIKPELLIPPSSTTLTATPPTTIASSHGSFVAPPAAAAAQPDVAENHINLRVAGANGEVFFKIKKTTPFKKLFDAYQQREGIPKGAVRFLYDGERLDEEQTPLSKDMREGDLIDAMVAQTGGGGLLGNCRDWTLVFCCCLCRAMER